jgi:hypothetical protein
MFSLCYTCVPNVAAAAVLLTTVYTVYTCTAVCTLTHLLYYTEQLRDLYKHLLLLLTPHQQDAIMKTLDTTLVCSVADKRTVTSPLICIYTFSCFMHRHCQVASFESCIVRAVNMQLHHDTQQFLQILSRNSCRSED